ncbi:MAG: hemerythrin domain-containing protein [Kiloniellales bacterium]
MPETMAILIRDHRNLARLLTVLERQVTRFEQTGEADFEIVQAVVDYCLTYPDLCHHPREDVVLRRLLLRDPRAAGVVGDLAAEHRELARVTRHFAAALYQLLHGGGRPEDWFGDAARDFLDGYRRHMDREETLFFPIALQELDETDWAAIDGEIAELVDPLFGGKTEARFKALRNEILMWDEIAS